MNLIRSIMISKLALIFSVGAQVTLPEKIHSNRVSPVVKAVDSVIHSVVSLGTEVHEMQLDENGEVTPVAVPEILNNGSGVIIDSAGFVLTAYHVVSGFETILLSLKGGRLHRGELVQFDEKSDLALIRIIDLQPGETLSAIQFAYAHDLLLGESVIAVGSPYGLSHSVSLGILSAKDRVVTNNGLIQQEALLQSDIAINPGNSGGPLINADGELIGINIARRATGERISFAVPISRIELYLNQWLSPQNFSGAKLGFTVKSEFSSELGRRLLIDKVDNEFKEILKPEEEIMMANDVEVKSVIDFYRLVHAMEPKDKLELKNSDGEVKTMQLKATTVQENFASLLGVELQEINESIAGAIGLPYSEGYIVSNIESIANRVGGVDIRRGDYILKLGDYEIKTEVDLTRAIRQLRKLPSRDILVSLLRADNDELTYVQDFLSFR
jgi:serine protease Do